MNEGLPNTLLLRARSVFAKNSLLISSEFAMLIILSFSKLNSEHISEIFGSVAGSLPSRHPVSYTHLPLPTTPYV